MNSIKFAKTRETFDPIIEKQKYYNEIKDKLPDIKAWHESGYSLFIIEKRLGLDENELWYMVYYCKIKELRDVFISEKKQLKRLEETLVKLATGYYAVVYDKDNKPSLKYIPPDIKALEFLLSNKMPDKYSMKGQEPTGEDEENLKYLDKFLKAVDENAKKG